MKKIVVTGTKGKTTVVFLIDYLLRHLDYDTVRVDSNGSFVNGKKETNNEDSIRVFGREPNVMPGRYLPGVLRTGKYDADNIVAVLEAGLGCGSKLGTGLVGGHNIGVITNIFSDHINYKKIRTRRDLLKRKSFALFQTKEDGFFVFNADDKLIRDLVIKNSKRKLTFVPVTKERRRVQDLAQKLSYLRGFGLIKEDSLEIWSNGEKVVISKRILPYTYGGRYEPMLYNYLFAIIVTSSLLKKLPEQSFLTDKLRRYRVPARHGRYLKYEINGKNLILDYAHDIGSLRSLISIFPHRQITLVTRAASNRTNKFILDFARSLSRLNIKGLVIYDKVDGTQGKKKYIGRSITREVGESSSLLVNEILKHNPSFKLKRILNEQEALREALKNAKKGEVVIHIQNDIKKDLALLKSKFRV
jgi:cyanophycin synthetase